MKLKVVWTRSARKQLRDACNYIRKDSFANAEKVGRKILAVSASLSSQPLKYPPDKDKADNEGNFRAFIVYRYKISYWIQESEITILRLRHTSMEPLEY